MSAISFTLYAVLAMSTRLVMSRLPNRLSDKLQAVVVVMLDPPGSNNLRAPMEMKKNLVGVFLLSNDLEACNNLVVNGEMDF
eukprot:13969367-Ditylum_brightwellii.AAC.1